MMNFSLAKQIWCNLSKIWFIVLTLVELNSLRKPLSASNTQKALKNVTTLLGLLYTTPHFRVFVFSHHFFFTYLGCKKNIFWGFGVFSTNLSNEKMMQKYENTKIRKHICIMCNDPYCHHFIIFSISFHSEPI